MVNSQILYTHTRPFNGLFWDHPGEPVPERWNNLDFTEARDSEWQWHQLGHMQVCISLQTDNRASTPPLVFLHAGCPSCCPTNSVKALKPDTMYRYICLNMLNRQICLITCCQCPSRLSAISFEANTQIVIFGWESSTSDSRSGCQLLVRVLTQILFPGFFKVHIPYLW